MVKVRGREKGEDEKVTVQSEGDCARRGLLCTIIRQYAALHPVFNRSLVPCPVLCILKLLLCIKGEIFCAPLYEHC